MYIYEGMRIYACRCVCGYTYGLVCVYLHMFLYAYTCVDRYACVCRSSHLIYMHILSTLVLGSYLYIRMYVQYVYMYICIYMCVYIYAYMCARAHIGTHS